MGDSRKFEFVFWGGSIKGDCDVWVWGVSSCVASEFEYGARVFFFVWSSVNGSPAASIGSSFFIKDTKSTLDRCGPFEDVMFFFHIGNSPL